MDCQSVRKMARMSKAERMKLERQLMNEQHPMDPQSLHAVAPTLPISTHRHQGSHKEADAARDQLLVAAMRDDDLQRAMAIHDEQMAASGFAPIHQLVKARGQVDRCSSSRREFHPIPALVYAAA